MKTIPVIYEMEPIGVGGALEATNVHWFCSETCRNASPEVGERGESSEVDCDPLTVCEWCEKLILE